MAKKTKLTNEEQVTDYLLNLEHPLKPLVEFLREVILTSDNKIEEQIKWNSPSFYYSGEMQPFDPKEYKRDIVVFNLHKKDVVLLVFPTGSKINDQTGLLEGKYPDGRRIATFSSMDDAIDRKDDLQAVLKEWILMVDK
ncbi:MAG: DUF1801 domain-containing protein [Ignavibacteriae bacterium]|nr:DUF1801 domain-containing protein [Ignavibacteriota bacterium]